jgi:hypothetical protein
MSKADMLGKVQVMMNKIKKGVGPPCDAACQATKDKDKYLEEYQKIKNDFLNGEDKVKNAEQRYYTKTNQTVYYSQLKETRATKFISDKMKILQSSFNEDIANLRNLTTLMGSQNSYKINMSEVADAYKSKHNSLKGSVDQTTGKRKINNRLADFYNNRDESWAVWMGSYLWYIYFALIGGIIIKMILSGGWKSPRKYLFVTAMFLSHYIVKFIFMFVLTSLGHFKLDVSYLVFILSFMIIAFIYLKIYDIST